MWKCISNLTVDPLTVDCWSSPWNQQSTVLIIDHQPSHCWLLIIDCLTVDHWPFHCWLLIIDCLNVDHWPSHCWLLINSVDCLTVDCWSSHCWLLILPPRINSQQCWMSITNPLTVDCWSLIASLLTIDPLTVDCWSSITSLLTVDPLTVDCWSIVLIVDNLTVDHSPCHCRLLPPPPRINTGNHLFAWNKKLPVDPLTVYYWFPPCTIRS